jgi:hypothetical protein
MKAYGGVLVLAATVGLASSMPVAAQQLGRVFFTPQQRQDLDRRRDTNVVEAAAPVVESLVTVNGHVVRSSGKSTTWINGVAQHDAADGRDPARPRIVEGDSSVQVKVGQTYDRTQGETRDPLGEAQIRVPSRR